MGPLARCRDIGSVLEEAFRPAKDSSSRAQHYRTMADAVGLEVYIYRIYIGYI
jgi:dihydrodipicolinate synthase/N-acetylneuraminate lyase